MGYLQKICDYAVKGIEGENEIYTSKKLIESCANIIRPSMSNDEVRNSVIQISLELTTDSEPKWQYVASKLYIDKLYDDIRKNRGLEEDSNVYGDFYNFISAMTERKLYGEYILNNYSKDDIDELEKKIKPERDFIFTYSGIDLLAKRYLIQDFNRAVLELPQQMFMGIAMHLAIPEKKENRLYWAKRFYDVLSSLKATMATPTMSNARKPFYQLSSCFIDTVDDSLKGIYK